MSASIDLTGKRFGYLVAIERNFDTPQSWATVFWICKCDCGQETVVRRVSLQRGLTKSCGCSRYQLTKGTNREKKQLRQSIRESLARVSGTTDPTLIADAEAILRLRRTTVTGTQVERLRKIAAELEKSKGWCAANPSPS